MASTPQLPSQKHVQSRMKMRYLLLLVAIDDLRSVHKAAEVMHISQPAATKLLAELEKLVGVRLFDRTTRGLTPTKFGESLISHARVIVASLDTAWDELDALNSGATGKINVGAIVAAEAILLPRGINQMKSRYPNLSVSIKGGTFDSLVPELRAGGLDIIVARISEYRHSAGIRYERLYEEPMRLMCRKHHPLVGSSDLSLSTLSGYPWIWPPVGSVYHSRMSAMFRLGNVAPPADIVESECTLANKALIQSSDRIGALPLTVAQSFEHDGGLVTLPMKLPSPSGMLGIIVPNDRAMPLGAMALVEALRNTACDIGSRFPDL